MVVGKLPEDAARAAYLSGFHAAQAAIFEDSGKTPKTYSGVQAEFHRLSKSDPGLSDDLRKFLSRAYRFKSVADYETGPDAVVSVAEAEAALATARRLVAYVRLRLCREE
jgi:uncharacterized protein (UPF0332 family)